MDESLAISEFLNGIIKGAKNVFFGVITLTLTLGYFTMCISTNL